jgi:2,3-bisphosphoglycerate-independent phosphoglycerate mutase
LRAGGSLCDLAPTLLELVDVDQPATMTGESLLE